MEKNHILRQKVISIVLLYVIITSIFEFLAILNAYIVLPRENYVYSIIMYKGTVIVFRIVAIVLLVRYLKKTNEGKPITLAKNQMVRTITGALVAIQGGLDLSTYLPNAISSIQSYLYYAQHIGIEIKRQVTINNILTIVIILGQIIVGIYLMYFYNKRVDMNETD
ncbi:hypothetical protein GC105_14930 [Alkalibaculum sp. M08DMB]|uniref:Uncharacterized protein n=1 Tax=Alkalibaculum sporogenes TaxID=2655001 RepID=A0A6A7KCB2_9FIRM|nr:hypothetical protein [Alkalibaculum sporogenes]MPW27074.1 hypothetical protein [Alkalibaculum sporogenes]